MQLSHEILQYNIYIYFFRVFIVSEGNISTILEMMEKFFEINVLFSISVLIIKFHLGSDLINMVKLK